MQDPHRQALGLRARRPAVRRPGAAGRAVRLFAHAPRRVSAQGSRRLVGRHAGRRVLGLQRPLRAGRKPAPVVEAACWAHGRRDFFDFAKLAKAPIAVEIVRRIDELFAIERDDQRRAARGPAPSSAGAIEAARRRARGLYARAVRAAVAEERPRQGDPLHADAMGRRSPDSSTTEESASATMPPSARLRCVAVGRRNWTFAGSDEGASYCSSRHPLISQRDFFGDRQTAADATAERWLRAERSRAPTRRVGLSRARPCTAGPQRALFPRSTDARSTC